MKNKYFILAGVVLIFLFIVTSFNFTGFVITSQGTPSKETSFVKRVIDGDTVELGNGERVRLLGINTPERGQFLFRESSDFLEEMIEGEEVFLESDETDRDKYDRLLRYIYLDNTSVNLELVRKGFAKTLIISPDEKYAELFLSAEEEARNENIGIWKLESRPDVFCIGIFYLHYNAKGNDNQNLNDEFVTFRNFCEYPISVNKWVLKDLAGKTFVFPDIEVRNKTYLTVHTGEGKNNQTDIYWNNNRAIWNNNGDSLYLWDSEGNIMLNYSYK